MFFNAPADSGVETLVLSIFFCSKLLLLMLLHLFLPPAHGSCMLPQAILVYLASKCRLTVLFVMTKVCEHPCSVTFYCTVCIAQRNYPQNGELLKTECWAALLLRWPEILSPRRRGWQPPHSALLGPALGTLRTLFVFNPSFVVWPSSALQRWEEPTPKFL